jgi:hypothetical protein
MSCIYHAWPSKCERSERASARDVVAARRALVRVSELAEGDSLIKYTIHSL